jgi:hypothetical protein
VVGRDFTADECDAVLDVFVVGKDGAVYVTWEVEGVNGGHWADGTSGFPGPLPLSPALWMLEWGNGPAMVLPPSTHFFQ